MDLQQALHQRRARMRADSLHSFAQAGDSVGLKRKLQENPNLINERNPVVGIFFCFPSLFPGRHLRLRLPFLSLFSLLPSSFFTFLFLYFSSPHLRLYSFLLGPLFSVSVLHFPFLSSPLISFFCRCLRRLSTWQLLAMKLSSSSFCSNGKVLRKPTLKQETW